MNRLILLLLTLMTMLGLRAENGTPGQWRLHNTWDAFPLKVIDTKDRTFFIMLAQPNLLSMNLTGTNGWEEDFGNLFVLDKKSQEMIPYNASNYLHGNIIRNAAYNATKGYLMVIYDDSKIDILYDDDSVYTVPGLSNATLTSSKNVKNITFDPQNSCAYLATDFGYLVIDDKNKVIKESYIYNEPLTGIGRVGDKLIASSSKGVFSSPVSSRHNTFDSFQPIEGISGAADGIVPINDNQFAFLQSGMTIVTLNADGSITANKRFSDKVQYFSENRDGYFILNDWQVNQLDREGVCRRLAVSTNLRGQKSGSWDFEDFYYELGAQGWCKNSANADKSFTTEIITPHKFLAPNRVFDLTYSDKYGMVAGNESFNRFLTPIWVDNEHLLSYYDGGDWVTIGGRTSTTPYAKQIATGYGPIVDPLDENVFWSGLLKGFYKVTLPENKVAIYTYANGLGKGQEGFHNVFTSLTGGLANANVMLGKPSFDADGNMWLVRNIAGSNTSSLQPVYVWPAADRLADNTASLKGINVKAYSPYGDYGKILALKHSSNRNLVLFYHPTQWAGGFYLLDHKGTLANDADDQSLRLTKFIDQNGNDIAYIYVQDMYEDPATGTVWVATSTGTFTFKPSELAAGKTTVNRIIVSRNDGTNQGDYLLAGNDIYNINADGAGRKWFSTIGSGIYVTSPNGDEVVEHFTTDNSLLPSDEVYCTAFDPKSNAVWIGTKYQLATYYSDVTPGEENFDNVVSYPNPVRPDYYGHVTIQGLMDGSLVKIIDQGGHLVKELGRSQGGMLTWDLSNVDGRRVSTGVYIIAASTEDGGTANAGKILVVK